MEGEGRGGQAEEGGLGAGLNCEMVDKCAFRPGTVPQRFFMCTVNCNSDLQVRVSTARRQQTNVTEGGTFSQP